MFVAPLTHVYSSGGICWGTVKYQDTYNPQNPYDFTKSWEALLGSRFGNHTGTTSSMKYKADIRKMWIELEETKATEYPVDDLIIAAKTLEQAIKEMSKA